jgi:hypothetical protein
LAERGKGGHAGVGDEELVSGIKGENRGNLATRVNEIAFNMS